MMEPINSHRQEKFMKRILVLLVSMYLVSGSVIAGGAFDEQFKKIDKNGDGQLSRQEFVESSNYKINRKKVVQFFPGFKDMSEVQEDKYRSQLFDAFNSNKDGLLSKEEWNKVAPNVLEIKF